MYNSLSCGIPVTSLLSQSIILKSQIENSRKSQANSHLPCCARYIFFCALASGFCAAEWEIESVKKIRVKKQKSVQS